ncbi:hypothetical protein J5N97_012363 [Dioscorea zingiberensis]|uniref:4-coumarate--CoA ligase n=1 Tax=Dioscorea zingiberensis TaxID=325984 RepID=A0A9D5CPK9_9LILI|nr:hypothetical protein J5N97_012363 [Dioscorea zingiberensis]
MWMRMLMGQYWPKTRNGANSFNIFKGQSVRSRILLAEGQPRRFPGPRTEAGVAGRGSRLRLGTRRVAWRGSVAIDFGLRQASATGSASQATRDGIKLCNMASTSAPDKVTSTQENLRKEYAAFQEKVKRTVFLDNMSSQVTEAVIRTALGQFGNVVNVEFIPNATIPFDIPQCALVEMGNEKEATAIISEMKNFPFMMSGMPRPVRAQPAKAGMFADRPSPPGRKPKVRWVKPSDPEFEVGKKLKKLVKKHRAETHALVQLQIVEEAKIEKQQSDQLKANYKKYEMIESVIQDGTTARLARKSKNGKKRGVRVEVGGEPDYAVRNCRFTSPVETFTEGVSTLAELFEHSCKIYSNNRLLGSRKLIAKETEVAKDGRSFDKLHLGNYEWLSYGEAFQVVCNFASGLVCLGHRNGERIAIFADTQAEWFIALQGCFRRNITVVTIYASLGEEALCHSLNETEVSTIICGHKELKKLVNVSGQLGTVMRVIYMSDDGITSEISFTEKNTRWTITSFVEVVKLGRENPVNAGLPVSNDIAVIMYTSGSTGLPKGVMMTHGNVLATVSAVMMIVPAIGSKDVYLAYLPLAHIFELVAEAVMVAAGCSIGYGSALTLTDTSNKIKKGTKGDASVLGPTLMAAVPAILDRVRDGVHKNVDAKGGLAKRLFEIAYGRRLNAINGSWFGAWGLEKILWNFLVFRKVQAILGGKIRFLLSGAAPLSADTQRFINVCLGAPIGQGYGLTETCAGGSFTEYGDVSVGRAGAPLPCSFIKLIDWPEGGYLNTDTPMPRGEIVIGGPNVTAGYFKNEAKTREVYKTDEKGMRWFYTGDIGRFHTDGCLEIIDRKKDIVKLQHGEYVSLGKIEAALIVSPYVDNIMLHADPFHSYCVAVVSATPQVIEKWALQQGITFTDIEDLCRKEETLKEVHGSLVKVAKQARLEKFEIPSKIKLPPGPWTPESGLVTAALKLKREVISKAYAEDIAQLYA